MAQYHVDCPIREDCRKRGTFNVIRYTETHEAASGVLTDQRGKMMHKLQYLDFAKTAENPEGALLPSQAEARWLEMCNEADAKQRLSDKSGPAESPLRLRVAVGTEVIFRNSYMVAKKQEAQAQRDVKGKAATHESAEAGRRALLRDHERGFGEDNRSSFETIGQSMVVRAGDNESSFAGSGIFMPDVARLQEDIQEAGEQKKREKEQRRKPGRASGATGAASDAESVDKADEAEPGTSSTAEKKNAEKGGWLDVGVVLKAAKSLAVGLQKLQQELEKARDDALKALVTACNKPNVEKETALAFSRLQFLMACLGCKQLPEGPLKEAPILQLADASGQTDLARLRRDVACNSKSRPPCPEFENLECMALLIEQGAATFKALEEEATSKDDVLQASKGFQPARQALTSLKQHLTKATKALECTQNAKKRVSQQAADSSKKESDAATRQPAKKPKTQKLVFEAAQRLCKTCPEQSWVSPVTAAADWTKPIVFRNTRVCADVQRDPALTSALDGLKKAWPSSSLRSSAGRAGQALQGAVADTTSAAMYPAAGPNRVDHGNSQALQKALAPGLFVVAAGRDGAFLEKDGFASLRLSIEGFREVALSPVASWAASTSTPARRNPVRSSVAIRSCRG